MTALDFKMLIVLLKLEYDRLEELSGQGKFHKVSRKKMLGLFEKYSGTKDDNLLFESLKRLAKFIIEFYYVDKGKREVVEGVASLLELQRRTNEEDEEEQYFRFRFADGLVPILINPKLFSILKVPLILEMRSKYTIALYQILVRHAEMKYQPFIEAEIDEWREWLKVPISDKKNSPWRSFSAFRQKVLEVAITELNGKSSGSVAKKISFARSTVY